MSKAREIAFIDPAVDHLDILLAGLRPDVDAIVLSRTDGAVQQIAHALQQRGPVDAVHIIAHGQPGELAFSQERLSIETLAERTADLAAIGSALEGGEILLWSCQTAAGEPGRVFLDALAATTGVHVGGSTNNIGSAALGGRWELDAYAGCVQATGPLTVQGQASYQGLMVVSISAASVTGVSTDTAPGGTTNTDFNTSDQTLTVSGTVSTSGSGTAAVLYIYLSGTGFSGGTDGQLVGQVNIAAGQTTWSFDLTSSTVPAAQLLAAGTYTLHVDNSATASSTDLDTQSLTIDITAPTLTPTITSFTTDTGAADHITTDNTPTLSGSGAGGSGVVAIYDDSTFLGTATANGSGSWSFTPAAALSEGDHHFTARVVDTAGNQGPASTVFAITVDRTAPTAPTLSLHTDSGNSNSDELTNARPGGCQRARGWRFLAIQHQRRWQLDHRQRHQLHPHRQRCKGCDRSADRRRREHVGQFRRSHVHARSNGTDAVDQTAGR